MIENRLACACTWTGIDGDRLEDFVIVGPSERLRGNDLSDFTADRVDLSALADANFPITIGGPIGLGVS